MNHFSFSSKPQLRKAATRLAVLIVPLLVTSLISRAQVVFDNVRDVGPPPSSLGIYNMIKVVDNTNANGSLATSVPLPNGGNIRLDNTTVTDDAPLTVTSPGTFFPWGHDYSGKVYGNLAGQRTRLYFTPGIKAFYLYAKPLFIRGDITVTAYSKSAIRGNVNFPEGVSFTRTISYTEAQFFGFHVTNPDDEIAYITIESTSPNPYVGEFGVAFECTDSAPYLTATNKELTCTNTSSALTAPAGGSNYTFTGPNSFSQSGASNRATVSAPGTYSLVAALASGCTARSTVTITENKTAPSAFFQNDGPLTCGKSSVTLTAFNQNDTNGFVFVFSGPNGFSQAGASNRASVSAPGTYSLIIRAGNGCLSPEYTTSVTSNTNAATSATQPLFDLYNATGGANWTRKDNWLTGCSPCGWYGVSCDDNGRVTGLNLPGNNLVGTLPTSLSALTNLLALNLSTNKLSGSIPASLSALRALQQLNLIGNQLSSTIPASFSALTQLQSLELGANPLTGGIPVGIGSLTALQTLNLSRTQLGGNIPASLGQLSQLQNLLLNESALTGSLPASLANLSQLQNLQLYTNQLSGCFPGNYTSLCGRASVSFTGNPGLPGGGDFGAFCRDGSGSELAVSQGPQSGTACAGTAFRFSVVARGAGSYQWYKLGPDQGQFQRLAETGPVLSFASVSASDAGTYQVYINYGCGNGAVQSDYVTLTVPPPGTGGCTQDNTAPVATANASQTATAGRAFTYTVNAFTDSETPNNLTYQVRLDPANIGLGFDAASRVISGTPGEPGPVSVTVTASDPGGLTASTSFTINVVPRNVGSNPLRVSLTASPQTLLSTGSTVLRATASGGTLGAPPNGYTYAFRGPGEFAGVQAEEVTVSNLPVGVQTFTVVVSDASTPTSQTASATVSVTVNSPSSPPPTSPFALTGVSTISCTPLQVNRYSVRFSPQYGGLDGSPVSFSVVSERLPTTDPGPYTLSLYTDNPAITLSASQGAATTTYRYNWLAACAVDGGSPTNRPPTTSGIPAQTGRQGQPYQLNLTTYFSDPEGQTLSYSVSGLPAGLGLSGSIISGVPSATGVTTVSVTAQDPGGLSVSTQFQLRVDGSPVSPPTGFTIVGVQTVSCEVISGGQRRVRFSPQYGGATGETIRFSVVNETLPTSEPGPYTLRLYSDNPLITLSATQGAVTATYRYNWLSACSVEGGSPTNQPPTTAGIPDQTGGQNQPYQLSLSNYFSDPEGQVLSYSVSGLPAGLSLSGSVISGVPSATGVSTVSVTGQDPGGLSVSTQFQLRIDGQSTTPPTGFTLVGVTTVSCEVVSAGQRRVTFTPQYAGLDGSSVSFSVVNETLPTSEPGPYTLSLYTDNPVITLSAQQGSSVATYRYNWLGSCGANARLGVSPEVPLSVVVLGNPLREAVVTAIVGGASGQRLSVRVIDERGRPVSEAVIPSAATAQRVSLPVGDGAGTYLLQVSTSTQRQTVKLLKTN